jgi:fatty acid kinase
VVGQDVLDVTYEVLERILSPAGEMVTVVFGDGADPILETQIGEHLRQLRPDVDLIVYDGGQENYPLFIAVE